MQEVIQVSSLMENGHIESLQSILAEEVIERFEFESLEHQREILDRYFRLYNEGASFRGRV